MRSRTWPTNDTPTEYQAVPAMADDDRVRRALQLIRVNFQLAQRALDDLNTILADYTTSTEVDEAIAAALAAFAGTANIITVGPIGTGTWQADVIDHERGGLEADVSSFDGLVAITGGSTVAIALGIADNGAALISPGASIAENDYAKFDATGLIGQTYAQVRADLFSYGYSVTETDGEIKLNGDEADPGGDQVYSTDVFGNRGWHDKFALYAGGSNQILGMDSDGHYLEYKIVRSSDDSLDVTHYPGEVDFRLPQQLKTTSSPTFDELRVSGNLIKFG